MEMEWVPSRKIPLFKHSVFHSTEISMNYLNAMEWIVKNNFHMLNTECLQKENEWFFFCFLKEC